MRTLDKIKAEGFKSISTMDLRLRDLNVLVGANGVGKSNFIGLFKLLNQISEGNLQVYVPSRGGADALLHFGRKKTERITINLQFEANTRHYWCELTPTSDDRLFFSEEGLPPAQPQDQPPVQADRLLVGNEGYSRGSWAISAGSLGRGHKESRLLDEYEFTNLVVEPIRDQMRRWRVYHFQDTSDSAKVKQTCPVEDNRILHPDAANLAAFLYLLREKHPSHYNSIVDATRLVFPFFDEFALEPSRLNSEFIKLEWREKGSESYFDASALSDGTLRFICLSTLLLQPNLPSVLLLDEPELGLHPYAINILAELLRGAATKTQVIASTQSVSLVNQFDLDDVIVVEREEGHSVFERPDKAKLLDWLNDYGVGDLWEKNLIGGRP